MQTEMYVYMYVHDEQASSIQVQCKYNTNTIVVPYTIIIQFNSIQFNSQSMFNLILEMGFSLEPIWMLIDAMR